MPVLRRNRNDCSGSFATDFGAVDNRLMSASLQNRTRGQSTGMCCDGAEVELAPIASESR